jgi:hypothetical protein
MIENLLGGGGGGGLESVVAGTGISVDNTNPDNPVITNTSLNTDETAKVSANDTTAGYLNGKLVAGTNVTFTENNDGGNETLTIAAAGGVTGFTGSQNDTSPNNTVNASRLLVDATSTNADFVAQPKGTGALLAQLPDGAATGGNKRGANAVDLQTSRVAATQVASGARAMILAGQNNVASGTESIAIGYGNTASNTNCTAIGRLNTVSVADATAIGRSNTVFSADSIAIGREHDISSGSQTIAIGRQAAGNGSAGSIVVANGVFSNPGDAQREEYVCRRTTTNDVQTELTADGAAPFAAGSATNRVPIANDSAYAFFIMVVARNTATNNESAAYIIQGAIDNNANTVAFVGSPTVTILGEDVGAWDATVAADNTNKSLQILVTGENSKTIRWVASVRLVKVTG